MCKTLHTLTGFLSITGPIGGVVRFPWAKGHKVTSQPWSCPHLCLTEKPPGGGGVWRPDQAEAGLDEGALRNRGLHPMPSRDICSPPVSQAHSSPALGQMPGHEPVPNVPAPTVQSSFYPQARSRGRGRGWIAEALEGSWHFRPPRAMLLTVRLS